VVEAVKQGGPVSTSAAQVASVSSVSSVRRPVVKIDGTVARAHTDSLAVEEPLEIRLAWSDLDQLSAVAPLPLLQPQPRREKTLAITMRTPGNDLELALGFLVGEGLLRRATDLASNRHCGPAARVDGTSNIVRIELAPADGSAVDLARLERNFYTSSSCGVCGKTSLEAVQSAPHDPLPRDVPVIRASVVHGLAAALRQAQEVFERTGGLHAAGLFDEHGELLVLREDVGRHNAVDKVVGARLLAGATADDPLRRASLLMVSGRASFELVQKAVMAGLPVLAAVGAPSSLAIELAESEGLTVLGFVRDGRFNVYSGAHRIAEGRPTCA
jgi:FdhD protein